jgi:excisionase family DNA binding protein
MSIIALQAQDGDEPLVYSPKKTKQKLQVSHSKFYELLNSGELESYTEGRSRRITVRSINSYIERRLAAEKARRHSRETAAA